MNVRSALSYGSDPSQAGDLYLPGGASNGTVCLLHGGFWYKSYGRDLMAPLANDLCARGFAVWNLEYRRIGNGGGWPNTFADVSRGIDHLAQLESDGTALDLERVVAIGHSAGGHLALWAAGRHHIEAGNPGAKPRLRVGAAVGQAPVADLVRCHELHLAGDVVDQLLGGAPGDVPERYRAASPRALLPLGVPQLIVHGNADRNVPIEISRGYVAAARAAHDPIEFDELDGVGHFEHLDPSSSAWAAVVAWLHHAYGSKP